MAGIATLFISHLQYFGLESPTPPLIFNGPLQCFNPFNTNDVPLITAEHFPKRTKMFAQYFLSNL